MKRPNLNQVVSLTPQQYIAAPNGTLNPNNSSGQIATINTGGIDLKAKKPSKLAYAGSLNILSSKGGAPSLNTTQEASEETLRKVMFNMEKEKSLQFRQNTNNRGYGFQQVI